MKFVLYEFEFTGAADVLDTAISPGTGCLGA